MQQEPEELEKLKKEPEVLEKLIKLAGEGGVADNFTEGDVFPESGEAREVRAGEIFRQSIETEAEAKARLEAGVIDNALDGVEVASKVEEVVDKGSGGRKSQGCN